MNYLVIGAGNAGRPVARLLNNQNHKVIITDPKQLSDFKQDVQSILKQMEKEGVILDLGNDNPSIDGIDKVYKATQKHGKCFATAGRGIHQARIAQVDLMPGLLLK